MSTPDQRERVLPRLIEEEMRDSFLDYSMSVIVQRALPDVRDGLKPVHRRILFAMSGLGLSPTRPYKKSASVVGEVLGKYHPHGDSAVYEALVRMVQDFSLRYPLVDGQGNFGSIDGDNAAAYRYTEARLTRFAMELLADIDKETVDFAPNFDDRLEEPRVLPARIPNLLVNGSAGIAVGMATNIPPHNLNEVVNACLHLIDQPDASVQDLASFVQGPDFPTGGYICGRDGVREAYETGRGRIVMRGKTHIEEQENGRESIIVDEIPFMVNKARMIEQIAELVREKKITDISDLRDESDRDGIRVVIELKRDAIAPVVLNQLYKHTQMQSTFGVIMLALVGGVPKIMNLREMIRHFLDHRHEVVVRRAEYELRHALDREHILEGLKIAVDNIDEVVELIKASPDADTAGTRLQARFALSERQAKAILDMRLARLTGLEIEKLEQELEEVRATIAGLQALLADVGRRWGVIKDELREMAATYGDDRRTEFIGDSSDLSLEDLIADEEMVITVSHQGYIKRLPLDTYRQQRRGGRGLQGMDTKEEDWVEHLFVARTHDYLMIFTRGGRCYWLKVHQVPQAGRAARGKPIVNLLALAQDEQVAAVVPVREFSEDRYLMFATRLGVVKKSSLSAYGHVRVVGVNAINIEPGDELISVQISSGRDEVVLATRDGMAIRFQESDARPMGRATSGVRGISLEPGDYVVGMVVADPEATERTLLVVGEKGRGKRTPLDEYRLQRRGGKGVINFRVNEATGRVVGIKEVLPEDELMLITRNGIVNRQRVSEIRVIGRATQGVRLMSLDEGDLVVDVACLGAADEIEPAVERQGEDQPAGGVPAGAPAAPEPLAPAGSADDALEIRS
jgi:DNA gyrase subunit A